MNQKLEKIFTERINKFENYVYNKILLNPIEFDVYYHKSQDPILFENRLDVNYSPILKGDKWGEAWENAWFHLKGEIPKSWSGLNVAAKLNFTGEGLIFGNDGIPRQGLTSCSVYNKEFKRDLFPIVESSVGGEKIELWIEVVASGYLGINLPLDSEENETKYHGEFNSTVNDISYAIFNEEIWQFWLDLKVLNELLHTLPPNSVRRSRIIYNINSAIDAFGDDVANVGTAREILKESFNIPAANSDLSVLAVGHAHMDTAWLWPVDETKRKIGRSFANQIALLEKYPEYVFGASQPQHYVFAKQHYPGLFDKMKKFIDEGRWELQGGMWVEADNNLVSGESIIRQIIYGKNYFKDEFDFEVKNLWLPDVFGYSAVLPQILKKSGIDYFLTQKISWNQINEFPFNTFKWRGIDGTEIITHFPPENNYNSQLSPKYLNEGRENFKEKDFIDEFISLFGVGNGGGGPKEENIEYGKRMSDLEGVPKVRFGRADKYFEGLKKYESSLPVWSGELYLEFHRGTLTSQAFIKKNNRQFENRLRELEIIYSCLPLQKYPQIVFEDIWKTLLINQFHDIIPGSSVKQTYDNTKLEFAEIRRKCDQLESEVAELLFEKNDEALVLFNSLSYKYSGVIKLPKNWDCELIDSHNNKIELQKEGVDLLALVDVDPLTFVTLYKSRNTTFSRSYDKELVLENELVKYKFNTSGQLVEAYDKEFNFNILEDGSTGNRLSLYDDRPLEWDAWDIEIYYENSHLQDAKCVQAEKVSEGPVRKGLRFHLEIGNSKIVQNVNLKENDRRLDFETHVEWKEKHRMLRVSFPVNIVNDSASFDIQYGFIKRNTHRNTSWDIAKFEVCGHKYADLSAGNYGVSLLNDSKYGYKVFNNCLDLNLLRSPTYPDPTADIGEHDFTYSLLPHPGDLISSDVISQATQLNQGLMVFPGYEARNLTCPFGIISDGITIEQIKKAEKNNCHIIRIVEKKGCFSNGTLKFKKYPVKIAETDLMEWETNEIFELFEDHKIRLKPFEIRTYKVFL